MAEKKDNKLIKFEVTKEQDVIDLLNDMLKYNPGATNKMLSYPVKFDDMRPIDRIETNITQNPVYVWHLLGMLGVHLDGIPNNGPWIKATEAFGDKELGKRYMKISKLDGNC